MKTFNKLPIFSEFLGKSFGIYLIFFTLCTQAQDQDLALFEADVEQVQKTPPLSRANNNSKNATPPAFTLVGTSRFGSNYSAILITQTGENIKAQWSRGKKGEIEGYPNYQILEITSRTATISLNSNNLCRDSMTVAATCDEESLLILSLTAPPFFTDESISGLSTRNSKDGENSAFSGKNNYMRIPSEAERTGNYKSPYSSVPRLF